MTEHIHLESAATVGTQKERVKKHTGELLRKNGIYSYMYEMASFNLIAIICLADEEGRRFVKLRILKKFKLYTCIHSFVCFNMNELFTYCKNNTSILINDK